MHEINKCLNTRCTHLLAGTAPVQTMTIDTAVQEWPRLDFVKIDVEGAEQHAFRGMSKTLERFPNIIIVMEVNTARMGLPRAREFYEEIKKVFPVLRKIHGYSIQTTTVDEVASNLTSDVLLVLTRRTDIA